MKIFLRREGGQLPTYCPQGTIDTDNLPSEEAQQVINALQAAALRSAGKQREPIPDAFEYFIRLEKNDGSTEEFQVQASDLDSKSQKTLSLLMNMIQQSIKNP
jgi:hypothetical protein